MQHVSTQMVQHKIEWFIVERRHIEENLERYFYEETQRRPMVLPVIVEV